MRSGLSLFSAAAVLCGMTVAQADTGTSNQALRPGITRMSRGLIRPVPDRPQRQRQGRRSTCILKCRSTIRPCCRIARSSASWMPAAIEVEGSEFWGYNDAKKLLIFEGHWGSLAGLYLDGFGHREPLFDQVALPPVATTPTYVAPTVRCAGLCAADLRAADRGRDSSQCLRSSDNQHLRSSQRLRC